MAIELQYCHDFMLTIFRVSWDVFIVVDHGFSAAITAPCFWFIFVCPGATKKNVEYNVHSTCANVRILQSTCYLLNLISLMTNSKETLLHGLF